MSILLPLKQDSTKEDLLKQINVIEDAFEEIMEFARTLESTDKQAIMASQLITKTGFMWARNSLELAK